VRLYLTLLVFVVASLFQTGCSSLTSKNSTSIDIAKNERITLQISNALPIDKVITQRVRAIHSGIEYQMLAMIELEQRSLTMVGMSAFGVQLFSLLYAGGVITYDISPLIVEKIEPDYMLADFLLCYWPIEVLQQRLSDSSLRVQEYVGNEKKRVLYRDSVPVIEISYQQENPWQGRVTYNHLERDYQITIDTLEYEAL